MTEIKVSVLCTVYNHEKYIRKCIEGFVKQKTDFKYEVLIHDDCSTDHSLQIIEQYAKKYPDIIKVVSEKENQYSKRINISNTILFPKSIGKYIAVCEGDDYWCDDKKLQKQFDFMELNPNVSLCAHNTIIHDLSGRIPDKTFNKWCDIHLLSDNEIFMNWDVHISSFFFKRDAFEAYVKNFTPVWCGDYARLIYARSLGDVVALPDIMSVYDANNVDGSMWKNRDKEVINRRENERKKLLIDYDRNTEGRFHKSCVRRENQITYSNYMTQLDIMLENGSSAKERNNIYKIILNNKDCRKYLGELSLKRRSFEKIKLFIKTYFPFCFKLKYGVTK